ITGGEDAALFTINSSTGVLSFISAPNFENLPNQHDTSGYQVLVQASDGLGGTDTQLITVTVADVAETTPQDLAGQTVQVQYIFGTSLSDLFPVTGSEQEVNTD